MEIFPDKSVASALCFLQHVIDNAPFTISKLLTDNGKEFTDLLIPNGEREPTRNHVFDKVCTENAIEHRLTACTPSN